MLRRVIINTKRTKVFDFKIKEKIFILSLIPNRAFMFSYFSQKHTKKMVGKGLELESIFPA